MGQSWEPRLSGGWGRRSPPGQSPTQQDCVALLSSRFPLPFLPWGRGPGLRELGWSGHGGSRRKLCSFEADGGGHLYLENALYVGDCLCLGGSLTLHPFLSLQATLRNYWSVFLLSLQTFFTCIWCQLFCKAVIGNNKPVLTSQCNLERSLLFLQGRSGCSF